MMDDIEERVEYLEEELGDSEEFHIAVAERFKRIEERLDALESHRKREAKLIEIEARREEENLKHEPPEVRAEVERRIAEIMKELNE